eukprot:gene55991-50356_t
MARRRRRARRRCGIPPLLPLMGSGARAPTPAPWAHPGPFRVLPDGAGPLRRAEFAVQFDPSRVTGPGAAARIAVAGASAACGGASATGGEFRDLDADHTAAFTLSGPQPLGPLRLREVCFHPRVVGADRPRQTLRFSNATPAAARFMVSARKNCDTVTLMLEGEL